MEPNGSIVDLQTITDALQQKSELWEPIDWDTHEILPYPKYPDPTYLWARFEARTDDEFHDPFLKRITEIASTANLTLKITHETDGFETDEETYAGPESEISSDRDTAPSSLNNLPASSICPRTDKSASAAQPRTIF